MPQAADGDTIGLDRRMMLGFGTAAAMTAFGTGTQAQAALPAREILGGPGGLRGPSPLVGAGVNSKDPALLRGPYLDLMTPRGNREAWARLLANIDMTSTKYGWYTGKVMGVRPGEAVRDLVGFTGMSCARVLPLEAEGGGYRKILREVGFYTDLRSGEIIEEWNNPYLNETVKIVPIANDPFNHLITDFVGAGPSYGGLNTVRREPRPLQFDWARRGDRVTMMSSIHLYYRSALDPKIWPRENGSVTAQVSEMFTYDISWADMQNPKKTSIEFIGTWNRVTPWLPWMLMGTTPGHCQYLAIVGAVDDINRIDRPVLDYTAKHFPKFLEAPDTWEDPSHSSIEWYARTQTPAPLASGARNAAPDPVPPAWLTQKR